MVASTSVRRPLPAVIALAALLLLTAIVWWRVLNRDSGSTASPPCPTQTPAATASLPGPSLVTVQVLNSTNRQGIADKARATLVNDGFNSPDPAGNDKPKVKIPGVAQIRYGNKGKGGAKLLHYYFPKAKLVHTKSKTGTVVVSLGDRYQGVASPSTVSAALQDKNIELRTAAPGPSSASPSC